MDNSQSTHIDESQETPADDRLSSVYETAIRILRSGFAFALIVFVAGLMWSAIEREPLVETVEPIQDLPQLILDGEPSAAIDLGIVILMMTPVATVLGVAIALLRIGDVRYGILSILVLTVLVISIGLAVT